MPFLSNDDLNMMRSEQAGVMDLTATVMRLGTARDSMGAPVTDWQPVAQSAFGGSTSVACSVTSLSYTEEQQVAGKLLAVQSCGINMPVGVDLNEKDRIVVGAHTYEVIGVTGDQASYQVCTRVLVKEVLN